MNRGIAMVAFGKTYEKMAAHCMYYCRENIEYPIELITNVVDTEELWKKIEQVKIITMYRDIDENRDIKTSIYYHTSFDECLYVDCDSIFQNKGLEKFYDMIPDDGIILNRYSRWNDRRKIPSLYLRSFRMANVDIPIKIYYGACMMFRKCKKVEKFFNLWNRYWKLNGSGRDMPSLACAVRNSGINSVELSRNDGLFSWIRCNTTVIQHEYGGHLRKLVGNDGFRTHKPFDKGGWKNEKNKK